MKMSQHGIILPFMCMEKSMKEKPSSNPLKNSLISMEKSKKSGFVENLSKKTMMYPQCI
jgi:hypothetical protein